MLDLVEAYLAPGRRNVARYLLSELLQELGDAGVTERAMVAIRYRRVPGADARDGKSMSDRI